MSRAEDDASGFWRQAWLIVRNLPNTIRWLFRGNKNGES